MPRTGLESHCQIQDMGGPQTSIHALPLSGPTCTPWSSSSLYSWPVQVLPACPSLKVDNRVWTRLQPTLGPGPDADRPIW